MSEKLEDIKTLEDFSGWDATKVEVDFFSNSGDPEIKEEEDVTKLDEAGEQEEPQELDKEGDESNESDQGGEEDESEDITFFQSEEEEEGQLDSEGEEAESTEVPKPATSASKLFKDTILDGIELEEGLSEEEIQERVLEEFDNKIESRVEELFAEMDPLVANMVKYAVNGGDVRTLLTSLKDQKSTGLSVDMDMSEEANQIMVAKQSFRDLGMDDEEIIQAQVETLKASGKLAKFSEGKFNEWKQKENKLIEQKAAEAKQAKKDAAKREAAYKKQVATKISETKEVKGMPISRKDKKELPSYMTDRNISLTNGSQITQMQQDLYAALQDEEKSMLLAKLLKSDFDFSSFKRAAKTEISKKQRESITHTSTKNKARNINSKKSLADFF
jgi:hypothetical protein